MQDHEILAITFNLPHWSVPIPPSPQPPPKGIAIGEMVYGFHKSANKSIQMTTNTGKSINHELYYRRLLFDRALAFVCHGFAEHSGYYNDVAEVVAAKGFLVAAHDHGRSQCY